MIDSFVASWPLFHNAYIGGWLIAILLAVIGVLVVARDQIFVGAAVSQASLLGITVGIWLGSWAPLAACAWCQSDGFHSLIGGVFAVLGALLAATGGDDGGESRESVTGWVFLLGSSLSVIIVASSPHGLEEVHRLLASTIIGATSGDAAVFALLTLATGAMVVVARPRLLLLVMDPEMARAVGINVVWWDRALSIWLGFAVALAIRVSGVTYTFGCLVLPALIAKNVCREVGTMFMVAPVIALGAALAGFVLANYYDWPPGQVAVMLLVIGLALAWGIRAGRQMVRARHLA